MNNNVQPVIKRIAPLMIGTGFVSLVIYVLWLTKRERFLSSTSSEIGTSRLTDDVDHDIYVLPISPIKRSYVLFKRIFDFVASFVLLTVLSPFMVAIAIAIRLDSTGPALFKQERVGVCLRRQGARYFWVVKPFVMYKYRSMDNGNSSEIHEEYVKAFIHNDAIKMAEINKGKEATFKLKHPHVTRAGAFLRKTSLDELPQLINVLKGEMSLVGPRPALFYELDEYQNWHKGRLTALPGITGYWQAFGRSSVEFDKMVRMDIWYAKHQSIWLDLLILLMTPLSVVKGKGAV